MHRSSEMVGKIAAALALAQRTLQNPEKSLVAAIPASSPQEQSISFRYASLASGLDIIRKALGEQEIATVQTTSFDKESGLIHLSTVLVHSSGEWIASDWPVCAINEIGSPHKLGAALTYARRYGLFTLAGIAGEDDLEAPDASGQQMSSTPGSIGKGNGRAAILPPGRSENLRDQLLAELAPLQDVDDLTLWTLRRMAARNTLQREDAERVGREYIARLELAEDNRRLTSTGGGTVASDAKAVVPMRKTTRHRNKSHLAFVSAQPCMVCKRTPCDAHHLKFAQPRALGRKVSDEFTVPLCREHHQELHRHGNEQAWWKNAGLAPLEYAAALWAGTPDVPVAPSMNGEPASNRLDATRQGLLP